MSNHNRFHKLFQNCPTCKSKLVHTSNSVSCEACDHQWYDNPPIATSIALIENKKILLAKRGIEPEKGTWDILGGFIEAGESIEECAVREMKEETGLNVEIEEYLGSMADIYGGRPTTPVMFKVKSVDEHKKPVAQDDVEELRWFSLDEIPDNLSFKNVKVIIEKVKKYLV